MLVGIVISTDLRVCCHNRCTLLRAVRDAVDGEVKQLRVRFDRWQTLLQTSNTTDVPFQLAHEGMGARLLLAGRVM